MKSLNKIYPLIYGVFGSLGFICCINILLDFDYKVSAHPYAHPFCVIAGSLSLIICMAVFCFDITSFINDERKLRRILKGLLITVVSFVICFFAWNGLWQLVSEFIGKKGW
ncbi:MAG: hypothetical protein NC205_07255 [Prevotella sp.]|nr:hypothetical protein [Alistipes senegalensis]MCM1358376.1 hypothetical protein [Prevotella sp.]MCM1472727.1 hypothetical protein [Muribaculaceae bacterium]